MHLGLLGFHGGSRSGAPAMERRGPVDGVCADCMTPTRGMVGEGTETCANLLDY